jgi:hypothetical protein
LYNAICKQIKNIELLKDIWRFFTKY